MKCFLIPLLVFIFLPKAANAEPSLNLDFLSPTGSVGFLVLLVGIVVTTVTFYVFYNVSSDVDSVLDKNRKLEAKKTQDRKIARLYPEKK